MTIIKQDNLYSSANYEELLEYCNKIERIYPNDVNIAWYQALVYYQSGDLSAAMEKFLKTVEINPHYAESAEPYINKIREDIQLGGEIVGH